MKSILSVLLLSFMFLGCDQLKGKQGDPGPTGQDAVISIKSYTGTATSNSIL